MSEFQKRRAMEALELVKGNDVDAVILFPGANIAYYTGFSIGPSERLAAALIPVDGSPVFIVNELEAELRGQEPWFTETVVWREHEDPLKLLAETVSGRGLASATIGIPEEAPWGWVNKLRGLMPEAKFVDVSDHLGYVRMIKTEQELDWHRKACAIADEAMDRGFRRLHTTMTEKELMRIITAEMRSLGGGETYCSVNFGDRAALPHGEPTDRELKPGEGVLVDMGCTVHGYWSDITRTVFYGEPTHRQKEIYSIVLGANRAAFAAIKPGATCESVDMAARKIIEEAGFGEYFIHRLGHGIGMEIHEHPYIVKNNRQKLEPGMVFSNEPGIYIVGEIGVRIEDTVVCTSEGAESLTHTNRGISVYPVKNR